MLQIASSIGLKKNQMLRPDRRLCVRPGLNSCRVFLRVHPRFPQLTLSAFGVRQGFARRRLDRQDCLGLQSGVAQSLATALQSCETRDAAFCDSLLEVWILRNDHFDRFGRDLESHRQGSNQLPIHLNCGFTGARARVARRK